MFTNKDVQMAFSAGFRAGVVIGAIVTVIAIVWTAVILISIYGA